MLKFRKGRRTLAIIIVFLMSQMGPAADSPYKEDGLPIAKRGNHRSVTCQQWSWGGGGIGCALFPSCCRFIRIRK